MMNSKAAHGRQKKTPLFSGVLFRRGEGDDPFRVASLEEIVSFLVYF
jgi:hypothetical protein